MPEDKRTAVDELSLVTKWKLRGDRQANVELIDSLGWLGIEKPEGNQRVADFEYVNGRINELMQDPESITPQYKDAITLVNNLSGNTIPTLEEARKKFYENPKVAETVTSTINNAVKNYPEWAKVNPDYPSQGTPASGALIEGYGAFLGSLFAASDKDKKSAINRSFVLAFEEVLINEKPDSPLVRDVIGWMKEESDSFPEEIQPLIESASQK
jgi:hypothetical protein